MNPPPDRYGHSYPRPSPWRTFGVAIVVAMLVGCTLLVIIGVGIAMSKPSFGTNK